MNKLVLFDLDGTLIRSLVHGSVVQRFSHTVKKVFGIDIPLSFEMWKKYDGWGDRAVFWDLLKNKGISTKTFNQKLPHADKEFVDYLEFLSKNKPIYQAIPEARILFDRVVTSQHIYVGMLTANLKKSALWKLRHTGFDSGISFSVYGHEAPDRIGLAKRVIPKAKKKFGFEFSPEQIFFIGDTIHDVRAGKAIGAVTIAVGTGPFSDKTKLIKENPDLFVETLADPLVFDLLGIR